MRTTLPTPVLVLATLLGLAVPCVAVFTYVDAMQQRAITTHTELVSAQLVGRLQDQLAFRLALLRAIARELDAGGITTGAAFADQALELQSRFPGFQAINWVSPAGRIEQVVPVEANRGALGKAVEDHPLARGPYQRARRTGAEAVTGPLTLFQGGVGFASYLPVGDGKGGFVNGVFRVQPLLDTIVEQGTLEQFALELRIADEVVVTTGQASDWTHAAGFDVDGIPWELTLSATPELVAQYRPPSTRLLLALGLLTAVFGAVGIGMWRRRQQQQEALQQQLDQVRRIEALGALSGGIAHDFNNLLTVIGGTIELMARSLPEDSSVQDDIELLLETTDRAATLTSHLLAFSRHRLERIETFQPDIVLASTARMLARLLPESIELNVLSEAPDAWVSGDAGSFEQAVVNLALNARDAMPNGGHLSLRSQADEAHYLIEVIDDGTGMDAETQQRIFDPFFTTKKEGAGTGLGLSMAFRTAQQLGGTLAVVSARGEGTTMRLSVPLVEAPAPETPHKQAASPDPRRALVLLAEDDPAIRGTFRRALEDAGHVVLAAADGDEATTLLGESVDLLITDMVMPKVGGAELMRRFREHHRDAPILCCTGYADRQVPLAEDPRVKVLVKPVRLSELVEQVQQLLATD